MTKRLALSILAIAQTILPAPLSSAALGVARAAASQQAPDSPPCSTTGTHELTITCTYKPASPASADSRNSPRIVLQRAVISFGTSEEGQMKVELVFSNEGGKQLTERRTVYLAIDDVNGGNHVRRPLPRVDFTRLEPGKPVKFQDSFLAPAFSAGTYFVSLWIPANDPSSKFDPTRNFLLSSDGVPDTATGLNRIATFTAKSQGKRGSPDKQDP
jgi:hypothetical protein